MTILWCKLNAQIEHCSRSYQSTIRLLPPLHSKSCWLSKHTGKVFNTRKTSSLSCSLSSFIPVLCHQYSASPLHKHSTNTLKISGFVFIFLPFPVSRAVLHAKSTQSFLKNFIFKAAKSSIKHTVSQITPKLLQSRED